MMKVELTAVQTIEVSVEAGSRKEAIEIFRKNNPDFTITEADGDGVLGYCEVSGNPIFTDDKFVSDSEGVMILTEHYEEGDFE